MFSEVEFHWINYRELSIFDDFTIGSLTSEYIVLNICYLAYSWRPWLFEKALINIKTMLTPAIELLKYQFFKLSVFINEVVRNSYLATFLLLRRIPRARINTTKFLLTFDHDYWFSRWGLIHSVGITSFRPPRLFEVCWPCEADPNVLSKGTDLWR